MPELEEITWEIKPSQKRHKIQNILVLIAIPISFITIYSFGVTAPLIFTQDQNLEEYLELFSKPLLYLLTIFLSVITYFFLNKYLLYSTKTYGINTEGITLSIKGTKKNYLWKDFDFFYDFSNNEIINDKKVIYLKKKGQYLQNFCCSVYQ
ncbi:MAG: hypothetical protein WCG01_04305 [bacterium]